MASTELEMAVGGIGVSSNKGDMIIRIIIECDTMPNPIREELAKLCCNAIREAMDI